LTADRRHSSALLEGATAHGFEGELWTLERVAEVIQRLTGVRHHRRTCGRCCATEWAGRCSAPAAALCYGPGGGGAQLCFHLQSGNYTERLIVVLGELRRLLGGQKATLLEELLPAAWHRTDQYANNRVECDHGRLKARLRPVLRGAQAGPQRQGDHRQARTQHQGGGGRPRADLGIVNPQAMSRAVDGSAAVQDMRRLLDHLVACQYAPWSSALTETADQSLPSHRG
jgi:hypothetical protein